MLRKIEIDKRMMKALDASIKHWEENLQLYLDGKTYDISPQACALCVESNKRLAKAQKLFIAPDLAKSTSFDRCRYCPIQQRTGERLCGKTPYSHIEQHMISMPSRIVPNPEPELIFLKELKKLCEVET